MKNFRHHGGSPPQAWGRRRQIARHCPPGSPPQAWGRAAIRCRLARALIGSPPQAWGRRASRIGPCGLIARFTPTGVGTASADAELRSRPVHPHRRGDSACPGHMTAETVPGSPPQAWGRRTRARNTGANLGSPPQAWGRRRPHHRLAQSTVHPHRRGDGGPARSIVARTVHPHRRGDGRRISLGMPVRGSPPQAWGRHCCLDSSGGSSVHPHRRGDGVSPSASSHSAITVHPHRRGDGEFRRTRVRLYSVHPHRRGDGYQPTLPQLLHARFTPTGVGTARSTERRRCANRFTPTGVGTAELRPMRGHVVGSPPQAWGRPSHVRHVSLHRFTPTGVGTAGIDAVTLRGGSPPQAWGRPLVQSGSHAQTSVHPHRRGDGCAMALRAWASVHPHRRGDGRGASHRWAASSGSPPQAWGRR